MASTNRTIAYLLVRRLDQSHPGTATSCMHLQSSGPLSETKSGCNPHRCARVSAHRACYERATELYERSRGALRHCASLSGTLGTKTLLAARVHASPTMEDPMVLATKTAAPGSKSACTLRQVGSSPVAAEQVLEVLRQLRRRDEDGDEKDVVRGPRVGRLGDREHVGLRLASKRAHPERGHEHHPQHRQDEAEGEPEGLEESRAGAEP
eukprot:1726493-Pleurochrysis_carterae.AAC.4